MRQYITATLELESCVGPKSDRLVSQMEQGEELISAAITDGKKSADTLLSMIKQMMQKMKKIE